jgi:hypothetical protein
VVVVGIAAITVPIGVLVPFVLAEFLGLAGLVGCHGLVSLVGLVGLVAFVVVALVRGELVELILRVIRARHCLDVGETGVAVGVE